MRLPRSHAAYRAVADVALADAAAHEARRAGLCPERLFRAASSCARIVLWHARRCAGRVSLGAQAAAIARGVLTPVPAALRAVEADAAVRELGAGSGPPLAVRRAAMADGADGPAELVRRTALDAGGRWLVLRGRRLPFGKALAACCRRRDGEVVYRAADDDEPLMAARVASFALGDAPLCRWAFGHVALHVRAAV
jgi:hypothetical protein